MPIPAPKPQKVYQPAPEGKHNGVLIGVAFLGSFDDVYKGVARIKHEVMLTWEIAGVQNEDGSPLTHSAWYNVSISTQNEGYYASEKTTLLKHARQWSGDKDKKPFYLDKLVGMLGETHGMLIGHVEGKDKAGNAKTKAVIDKFYKATKQETATSEFFNFYVGDLIPEQLKWLTEKVATSYEMTKPDELAQYIANRVAEAKAKREGSVAKEETMASSYRPETTATPFRPDDDDIPF